MLVSLENHLDHLSGFSTRLVHGLVGNIQHNRQRGLSHPIKVPTVILALEPESLAERSQALEASKDRSCIVRLEETNSNIDIVGPAVGEVVGDDLGDDGKEMAAVGGRAGDEEGDEAVAEGGLLVFGDRLEGCSGSVFAVRVPCSRDLVLEI